MSKAIAIIPARGGSKRIPKKNIKHFMGKPIIAYSIEEAKRTKIFDKVVVSTDDQEIAQVAKKYGAEVPFIRPPELSDDFTGTGAVVEHAVNWYKKNNEYFDFVCTIYATAPFLQEKYLAQGYHSLKSCDATNSFAVTSMPFPIQRSFKITNNNRCEMFTPQFYNSRSQDLDEAFQDAGQFYWTKANKETEEPMFGNDSIPVILPRFLVQDIDTLEDWQRAEYMYQAIQNSL